MAITAKKKPLLNAKKNGHSNLTLEGKDFTDWKVEENATDDHKGEWKVKVSNKQPDLTKELRLGSNVWRSPSGRRIRGPTRRTPEH